MRKYLLFYSVLRKINKIRFNQMNYLKIRTCNKGWQTKRKKKSPNLFLLQSSAEQGQWKTERSKVWHSNLIPTLIGLVGPPVCNWQNSRNYPTISVSAGSAGDPANSLHPMKALISAVPARTGIFSAYNPGAHQLSNQQLSRQDTVMKLSHFLLQKCIFFPLEKGNYFLTG